MKKKSKRYVITGGCGFIGAALSAAVRAGGRDHALTVDVAGRPDLRVDVDQAEPDIKLADLIAQSDGVFHLAGNANTVFCEEHPHQAMRMAGGAFAVGELCRRLGKPLIFASTGFVYGVPSARRNFEGLGTQRVLHPSSVYGMVKQSCENALLFHERHGLRLHILRLFNVYGPGQENAVTYKSTLFLDKLRQISDAGQGDVIQVNAPEWVTRDFVYISDVLEAFIAAMADLAGAGKPRDYPTAINVARGEPVALGRALNALAIAAGRPDVAFACADKAAPSDVGRVKSAPYYAGEYVFRGGVGLETGLPVMAEHLLGKPGVKASHAA